MRPDAITSQALPLTLCVRIPLLDEIDEMNKITHVCSLTRTQKTF